MYRNGHGPGTTFRTAGAGAGTGWGGPISWLTPSNVAATYLLSSNVGVGTSNPEFPLDVIGTARFDDIIITGNLVTRGVKMYRNAPGPTSSGAGGGWGAEGGAFGCVQTSWSTHSNVAATFLLSSNVGVGTSNPEFPLDVIGTARFDDIIISGGLVSDGVVVDLAWMSNTASWASNSVVPYTLSGSYTGVGVWNTTLGGSVTIMGSNVGIGTVNPSFPLDVIGNIRASGNIYANGFRLMGGGLIGATLSECTVPYSSLAGAPWVITPNRDIVLSGRRVGIGKSDPRYILDVAGTIRASGGFTAGSDARHSTGLKQIPDALHKVIQLTGYTFSVTNDPDQTRQIGLLAQDVQQVFPELVQGSEETGLSIAYGNMTAVLIEAIKTLEARVSALG